VPAKFRCRLRSTSCRFRHTNSTPLISHYFRELHHWVRQNDRPSLYRIDINGTQRRPEERLGFVAASAAFQGFARAALEEGAFQAGIARIDAARPIRDASSAEAAYRIVLEELARVTEASHVGSGTPQARRIDRIANLLMAVRDVIFAAAHNQHPVAVRNLRNIFVALDSLETTAGASESFRARNTRIALELLEALAAGEGRASR
jgi:hypothetical protein